MIYILHVVLAMYLVMLQPSLHNPIPTTNEKLETAADPEPESVRMEDVGEEGLPQAAHLRQERDEREGGGELVALKSDTIDVMRKINPLTIANQVSQAVRKNSQKNALSKVCQLDQCTDRVDSHGPARSGVSQELSNVAEAEESAWHPPQLYHHQEPPNIVNKPRTNELGYSVIVVAGDSDNPPVQVGAPEEKQERIVLPVKMEEKENVHKIRYVDDHSNLKKKLYEGNRAPKRYNVKTDFPVYDEDLTFIPDPLQGILDSDDSKEQGAQGERRASQKEIQQFRAYDPHSVNARGANQDSEQRMIGGEFQCGSYKSNSTNN